MLQNLQNFGGFVLGCIKTEILQVNMRLTTFFIKTEILQVNNTKYAFDNIFQGLQDVHTFAPLQTQHLAKNRFLKSAIFVKCQQNVCNFWKVCKQNSMGKCLKIQLDNLVDF